MHIVASRIINTWRTRGIINTSIDPATNNNITQQETSFDTRTASNTKENSEDNSIESPEETASSFYLRGGEYNIFIINEQYAAQPESFGTVTVIGVIKLFPVYQTTPIMNGDNTADRR